MSSPTIMTVQSIVAIEERELRRLQHVERRARASVEQLVDANRDLEQQLETLRFMLAHYVAAEDFRRDVDERIVPEGIGEAARHMTHGLRIQMSLTNEGYRPGTASGFRPN